MFVFINRDVIFGYANVPAAFDLKGPDKLFRIVWRDNVQRAVFLGGLSMLAALQAPVIMMSQNRQAAKDRADAQHDYEINLKAELEIAHLHQKIDDLRDRLLNDLLTMQAEQTDLLNQIKMQTSKTINKNSAP